MSVSETVSSACAPLNVCFSFNAEASEQDHHKIYDKIIAGGGPAAIFTAHRILEQAKDAKTNISVLVIADRLSAPCGAGSQIVPEVEGVFAEEVRNPAEIGEMMRETYIDFKSMITRRRIACRLSEGYEIKAATRDELDYAVTQMTRCNVFKDDEIIANSRGQIFNLPGHDHSILVNSFAGQLNMPELLEHLIAEIGEMGGRIEKAVYQGHTAGENIFSVQTDKGIFRSRTPLLIATGALHHKSLFEARNIECGVLHTMGLVLGPLSGADASAIRKRTMAMTNALLVGDFLWGGVDDKNFFTFGRGDTDDPGPANMMRIYESITQQLDQLYPGLVQKYAPRIFFGPMLIPPGRMPVVGRMADCDVAGGWSGMGIIPGYAAARAYADWIVHGRDQKLKLFESFHPKIFAAHAPPEKPALLQSGPAIVVPAL
ncbi:MAG: FAD-binding oxidoreductase [Alphaproteobacteria bacterium PRO2]|nr:FAD-binding oxidoreductase [Alphaproteobacteria bacterium PRO2]